MVEEKPLGSWKYPNLLSKRELRSYHESWKDMVAQVCLTHREPPRPANSGLPSGFRSSQVETREHGSTIQRSSVVRTGAVVLLFPLFAYQPLVESVFSLSFFAMHFAWFKHTHLCKHVYAPLYVYIHARTACGSQRPSWQSHTSESYIEYLCHHTA